MSLFSHDLIELETKKNIILKNILFVEFFDKRTHRLIDKIKQGYCIDSVGISDKRFINRTLIFKYNKKLVLKPHNEKLTQGKDYILKITDKYGFPIVIQIIKIKTTLNLVQNRRLLVSKKGNIGFSTIQSCFNYVMEHKLRNIIIEIEPDFYFEPLYLQKAEKLKIVGKTVNDRKPLIVFNNCEKLNPGQIPRCQFLLEDCNNVKISNLNFYNTHIRTGFKDQAETLFIKNQDNSKRVIITKCYFKSEQDTLNIQGKSVIFNSDIIGNVDFIWGNPRYSFLINSNIITVGDSKYRAISKSGNGGYIVQSRCKNKYDLGFIFLNCNITYKKGSTGTNVTKKSTFLARPCNYIELFQKVTFAFCKIDSHINPKLWLSTPNNELKIKYIFI